jgi:hypothetical protein
LLCTFGHDEYWTREKRTRVETWLERGGNVAFFGGNTCWYRLRYDEETATLTRDGQWLDEDPEDSLTGLSYRVGGGVWAGPRPPTGYRIERSDHPLLREAQLRNGFVAGALSSLVGYEFDGIDPAHAPAGLEVLGRADLSGWSECEGGKVWPDHNAAMVTFKRGRGVIFNAGTTDWARALAWDDPEVTAITRSVVHRLST